MKTLLWPILTLLICHFCSNAECQSFEGTFIFEKTHVHQPAQVVYVKGDKTMRQVIIDSTEQFKLITDHAAGKMTMLKQKDDKQYGFTTYDEPVVHAIADTVVEKSDPVVIETTSVTKLIGSYHCTLIRLTTKTVSAEAWITTAIDQRLSKVFPEFINNSPDFDRMRIRTKADHHGFILRYDEIPFNGEPHGYIVAAKKMELLPDMFSSSGFTVFDKTGLEALMIAAKQDPAKKQELDEFLVLFGKN